MNYEASVNTGVINTVILNITNDCSNSNYKKYNYYYEYCYNKYHNYSNYNYNKHLDYYYRDNYSMITVTLITATVTSMPHTPLYL